MFTRRSLLQIIAALPFMGWLVQPKRPIALQKIDGVWYYWGKPAALLAMLLIPTVCVSQDGYADPHWAWANKAAKPGTKEHAAYERGGVSIWIAQPSFDPFGKESKPKKPLLAADPKLFQHNHKESWAQRLERHRALQKIPLTAEEREIYRRIRFIHDARDELESEDRYNALGGEPEPEIQR